MPLYHPFKPFFDKHSKILILSSFPSIASRKAGFYYQNKNNRFYRILEKLWQQEAQSLNNISSQKAFLKSHHIALWDIFACCEIVLSKDESIALNNANTKLNELSIVLEKAPVKALFITSKKAYEAFLKFYPHFKELYPYINFHYLPSSSSANATYNLERLTRAYKLIQSYL